MSKDQQPKKPKAVSDEEFKGVLAAMIPRPQPIQPTNSLVPARDADEDTAYDGFSKRKPRRKLTARERDILTRVLGSLVRPYYERNWEDPYYAEARAAFSKYTRLDHDAETMAVIMNVINPRDE